MTRRRTTAGARRVVAGAVALVLIGASSSAGDATRGALPMGDGSGSVALEEIGAGFNQAVNVAFAPGVPDHTYVVEQDGLVRLVVNDETQAEPFLDLTGITNASGEQGLLGLAFEPGYDAGGGLVYAYYTHAGTGDIVVSEFESTPLQADPKSRRKVIRIRHRMAGNHNGGQVAFGPDGFLYLATGDGGSGGDPRENAQSKKSLLGKLLRIKPRKKGSKPYTTPKSNPYRGRPGRPEIYARGLRNPFRFTFDPVTKRIAIGDVGQNRFEEVDIEGPRSLRNANFGWDRWEGFKRYRDPADNEARTPKRKNHDKPVFAYGRAHGQSVIGGVVVRDEALTNLYGRYLFADAFKGELRSLVPRLRRQKNAPYLDQGKLEGGLITSFASDPNTNEVYVTTFGKVFRLAPAP